MKTTVVIGAGVFGVSTANHLVRELDLKHHKVKLVTTSDNVYFLPSAPRLIVSKDFSTSIFPLKDVLDDGVEIIKDEVVQFSGQQLVFKSGSQLEFDVLIIASGSKWSDPIGSTYKFGDNYKAHFEKEATKIEKAKHILFIGGGFVNSEIAGELLNKYSKDIISGKKKVSIIQNSDKLLPANEFYSDTLRSQVTKYLESGGVKLYLNAKGRVSDSNPKKVILNDDPSKKIEADLVIKGVGTSASVPPNEISNLTNKNGFIRIRKNFQVEAINSGNVFAIGDVTDFNYRGLLKRDSWVNTIVQNVVGFLNGGINAKLADASIFKSNVACAVSLGPNAGYGQAPLPLLGTVSIPSFLIVRLKSRKLFSDKAEDMYSK